MSQIFCPRLAADFTWNFETEQACLRAESALRMRQPSQAPVATPFLGASVAVAHDTSRLYVVSELEDDDIFNAATTRNERTWMTGDVFEVFLRPESQEAYYEFHVTPENQTLQLRLPSSAAFYAKTDLPLEEKKAAFRKNLINETLIESRTEIRRKSRRWSVLMSVPLERLSETKKWEASDVWLVSFCRYDYTRGVQRPVVSSTSAHEKLDFHNQAFWHRLVFNSGDSLS